MQLTFLGTGAANAFPEPFCSCANCERARALGGRSLRARSSVLIDDALLIDFGPDVLTACHRLGLSLTDVTACLQTHPHADHLDVSHWLSRSPGFGVVGAPLLHWYASAQSARCAADMFSCCDRADILDPAAAAGLNLAIHQVVPFEPVALGRYRATPYPASHHRAFGCLIWAVEAGGRAVLYATDTGPLVEDVWQAFHRQGLRFDAVILDHTYGPDETPQDEHMCARQVAEHVARFRSEGLLAPTGRALATHIAHEGNPPYPELAAFAAEHGYEVAYDGLTLGL